MAQVTENIIRILRKKQLKILRTRIIMHGGTLACATAGTSSNR